jgi:hypothetical protein
MWWKTTAITLIILLSSMVVTTFAGDYSGTVQITEVYVRADGGMAKFQRSTGEYVNPEHCGEAGMYVLERDSIGYEAFRLIVTQLTTAMLTKTAITMWIEGCSSNQYWWATRPLIHDILLHAE